MRPSGAQINLLSNVEKSSGLECKYKGIKATQSYADFCMWQRLILEFRPEFILELGTGHGGFAYFLADYADRYKFTFVTMDNDAWCGFTEKPDRTFLGGKFIKMDIFDDVDAIAGLIREFSKVILFCDNGDKPREVETFSPFLPYGSLCVVHDWMTEFKYEDIPKHLAKDRHTDHTVVLTKC